MLREGGRIIGKPEHVVADKYLPVTLRSSADADGRDFQRSGNPSGQIGRYRLEHNRKHAGLLELLGIFYKTFCGFGIAALRPKAAELMHGLWRQAQVPH